MKVELSREEALVLFDWLTRHEGKLPFDHASEQRALWNLEAALERDLPEVVSPTFRDELEAARKALAE